VGDEGVEALSPSQRGEWFLFVAVARYVVGQQQQKEKTEQ